MRELHVSTQASINGLQDLDITFSRPYEQNDEWGRYANEVFGTYDTILAGRRTFLRFMQYKTSATAAPSDEIMSAQKNVVYSTTLTDEQVGNAVLIKDDLIGNVKAMKEQPGKKILCIGGSGLRGQLLNAGLVDRFKVWYVPVLLNSGRQVFENIADTVRFELMRTYTFSNGLIRAEYQVIKSDAES